MSNSNKQKGKRFEEYIAEKLRKHFNVDKRYITRAKSSGVSEEEFGDIIISPVLFDKFPYIIECKFGYDVKLEYYIGKKATNKSNPLNRFIYQISQEYNSYLLYKEKYNIKTEPIPILVFSGAYKDIYVSYIEKYTPKKLITKIKKLNYIHTILEHATLYTIDFKDFLKIIGG
jgi:hypothetical protein